MLDTALLMDNMKVVAIFALLVAAVGAKPRYDCPVDEINLNIPDDINCAIFYKCDHGVPVNFNCPGGLMFNPDAQICDWPTNVKHPGCLSSDQSSKQSTTTSSSYSTTADSSGTVKINTPGSDTANRRAITSTPNPSYSRGIRNLPSTTAPNTVTKIFTPSMATHSSSTVIQSSNKNISAYNATTIRSIVSTRRPSDTSRTTFYLSLQRLRDRRN